MFDFQPTPQALKNKTILVTGAGDGIGKAAAIAYAELGASIILLGKTVSKLEAVYDEIKNRNNGDAAIVPLDLLGATPKNYQDMALTIGDQFGKLDGLLHNASILGQLQPFAQIPEKDYSEVMQVNVHSHFFMTQALLPLLRKDTPSSVIFTTSTVGSQGRAYWGTYSISKFAIEGMMQVLADEYSNTQLRFNCINPGKTRTAMRAKAYPAEDATTLRSAEEILPAYLYLMCDDSKAITGKTFKAQPDL